MPPPPPPPPQSYNIGIKPSRHFIFPFSKNLMYIDIEVDQKKTLTTLWFKYY